MKKLLGVLLVCMVLLGGCQALSDAVFGQSQPQTPVIYDSGGNPISPIVPQSTPLNPFLKYGILGGALYVAVFGAKFLVPKIYPPAMPFIEIALPLLSTIFGYASENVGIGVNSGEGTTTGGALGLLIYFITRCVKKYKESKAKPKA